MPHVWNNLIVVTVDELVPAFFNTFDTLSSELKRNKDKDYGIKRVRRGCKGTPALISFDSLPSSIQEAIGDPRKVSNPLEQFFKIDPHAVAFYNTFRFEDKTGLPLKHIEEYIINASVLKAAMLLKDVREFERKSKGGSCKKLMATICNDVIAFNKSLRTNFNSPEHTLPASEKRFKEAFKQFSNGFNYAALISGKLKNENRKLVTDELRQFLNELFAGQANKPTPTEVARQYDAFLNGYVEVWNNETGEVYEPQKFKPLSQNTIINYLAKWEDKIATHAKRSGDRQRYMGQFKPYHSLEQPAYAGSIISIDDRQPPFKYDQNNRMWFYNAIDLGSEAFTCWVYGKSKEGIITEFYRQLIRNYHSWGIPMPAEVECEANLNASFKDTFLREGAMFKNVRIEANNARGKRIEAYYRQLRYHHEKQREGWLARPHARAEANQAGSKDAPIIPYNTIIQNALKDIEDWNNSPHSIHTHKTRWEVFLEMQHPSLQPTNWLSILPHLGYKTQTKCHLNGIINLNNEEYLIGLDGEVLLGDKLIGAMKIVAGENIDVYWLDDNTGRIIKALIFLRNSDRLICEAVLKPRYQRATIERSDADQKNYEIMSAYVATIEGYARAKASQLSPVTVVDNRSKTLNRKFIMPGLSTYQPSYSEPEVLPMPNDIELVPVPIINPSLKDRF